MVKNSSPPAVSTMPQTYSHSYLPFKDFDDMGKYSSARKGADSKNTQIDRELYSEYDSIDDADLWTCEDNDFHGQVNFDKLKSLRKDVNLEHHDERYRFYEKFTKLISEWKGKLPNLREVFRSDEIEALLVEAGINRGRTLSNYRGRLFIRFVKNSGYKDEPELGEDGKPLTNRATPLHLAARYCRNPTWKDMFRDYLFVMYDRFDVNYVDPETGLTHLHVACKAGCLEIVRKFLELGQDPMCLARETCETPLHFALDWGHADVVQLLLEAGAHPNFPNIAGSTPLHVICKREFEFDMAELFFEMCDAANRWVWVNAQDLLGRTPLQWAVASCSPRAVKALVERGAVQGFVFPDEKLFEKKMKSQHPGTWADCRLKLAAGAMLVVEHLENAGFELDLEEASFVMRYFEKFGLLMYSPFISDAMNFDAASVNKTKAMMLNPSLSVYDAVMMEPEKAAKRFTCADCYKLACNYAVWQLPPRFFSRITVHLFEIITRGYFRKWEANAKAEMKLAKFNGNNSLETIMNIEMYSVVQKALRVTGSGTKSVYDLYLQGNTYTSILDDLLAQQQPTEELPGLTLFDFPGLGPGDLLF